MSSTICRPLKSNVAERPPGAVLVQCEFCGADCWRLSLEPFPLPDGAMAACTVCAIKRGYHMDVMDEHRRTRLAAFEAAGPLSPEAREQLTRMYNDPTAKRHEGRDLSAISEDELRKNLH